MLTPKNMSLESVQNRALFSKKSVALTAEATRI